MSGSLQGAGGVGDLLAAYDPSTLNNQPSTHFASYDGNGNLSGLVNAADGTISESYLNQKKSWGISFATEPHML